MVLGFNPFKGDNLHMTKHVITNLSEIVNDPLQIPGHLEPDLADLLRGLLCKDAKNRLSLEAVANHPWVVRWNGPVR
ncbi:serine/threonine-protein kinase GRIK1-like [Physcomitrium patens]|uniref:serine/threonine-protein kinase GRIK1-like n=1 Tax=Physcomitrium patens TaxID=3218 RepID=UPI003CCD0636